MVTLDSHRIMLKDETCYSKFDQDYMLYPEYDELISQIEQMEDVISYTISSSCYVRYSSKYDTLIYYGIIHAYLDYIR